jgi:uncharacterized protein HemX
MTDPANPISTSLLQSHPVQPANARFGAVPHHVNWGVALGVLALVAVAFLWINDRAQSRGIKADLARKLAEMDTTIRESKLLSRNADETARQFVGRLAQAETQLADTATQRQALESLYQEFSRDRDQAILADIEQSLLAASQQLQLNGSFKSAIIALEGADQRLLRLDKPQFAKLRQAISNDLGKLRATPVVDYSGMSFRLSTLAGNADLWPLSSAFTHTPSKPAASQSLGKGLLDELKNVIQIRRVEYNEPALLTPSQDYFLRQNLKLRLLSARLSLLSRDIAGYQTDLRAAQTMLTRYFNTQDTAVANAQTELAKLNAINIVPPSPQIESLTAIQASRRH